MADHETHHHGPAAQARGHGPHDGGEPASGTKAPSGGGAAPASGKDAASAGAGAAGNGGPATWLDAPEEHDYPAARAYLSLIMDPAAITATVTRLEAAPTTFHAAKDLLRASRLPLLDRDNVHVARDLAKIARGQALSPVLLVRGDAAADAPLQIADGYHRVCASYHAAENTPIAARLVPLPAADRR